MNLIRPSRDNFDAACAAAEPGDVIVLEDAIYPTAGNWMAAAPGYKQLADGVCLIGAGTGRSIIRLDPDTAIRQTLGVDRLDRDLNPLWTGANPKLHGITVDANERAFRGLGTRPPWYVGGIRYHGRIEYDDLEVIGLRGTWQDKTTLHPEIEVFALSSTGETSGSRGTRLRVHSVADDSYVSGQFHGSTEPGSSRSLFTDGLIDLGRGNQFAISANENTTFRDFEGTGGRYGAYNDDRHATGIEILDCHLSGTQAGVTLVAQEARAHRNLTMRGGSITSPRGLEVVDHTNSGVRASAVASGVRMQVEWLACLDNPGAIVRVEQCEIPVGARLYRTKLSPEIQTLLNRTPDGRRQDIIPVTVA